MDWFSILLETYILNLNRVMGGASINIKIARIIYKCTKNLFTCITSHCHFFHHNPEKNCFLISRHHHDIGRQCQQNSYFATIMQMSEIVRQQCKIGCTTVLKNIAWAILAKCENTATFTWFHMHMKSRYCHVFCHVLMCYM